MGDKLVEMIDKFGFKVHNTGVATYQSGEKITAPDVSLSLGLTEEVQWMIVQDDLSTPHAGILIRIGDTKVRKKKEVINWKVFDWERYRERSKVVLVGLQNKWIQENTPPELMNSTLVEALNELVDEIAIRKTICCHSKPWIDKEVSQKLKELKEARKKFAKHRSPSNSRLLEKTRREAVVEISEAQQRWLVAQCNKLDTANALSRVALQVYNRKPTKLSPFDAPNFGGNH